MAKRLLTLLMGLTAGVMLTLFFLRRQKEREEQDADSLSEEINRRLDALEIDAIDAMPQM